MQFLLQFCDYVIFWDGGIAVIRAHPLKGIPPRRPRTLDRKTENENEGATPARPVVYFEPSNLTVERTTTSSHILDDFQEGT